MVQNKLYLLILLIILLETQLYSNEFTDKYCGAWCLKNGRGEITASISITKINHDVYYVIYQNNETFFDSKDNVIANSFSFAKYGFVNNKKIRIENVDYFGTQVFYELLLFDETEELYVMCNHEELIYPWNEADYPFYRVIYVTEEEIQKQMEIEEQNKRENIFESLRQK